jgi:hypothetical protein
MAYRKRAPLLIPASLSLSKHGVKRYGPISPQLMQVKQDCEQNGRGGSGAWGAVGVRLADATVRSPTRHIHSQPAAGTWGILQVAISKFA